MIDFEHRDIRVRIAQRESVETGAENHHLPNAPAHRRSQPVLGETGTRGHEQAHAPAALIFLLQVLRRRCSIAQNRTRIGVAKQPRLR